MPALGTHPTAGGVLFALQGKDGTIPTSAPLRRDDTNTYDVLSVGGAAIDSGSILFALNSAVRIAANPVAAQYPRTIAGVFNVSAIGGSLMSLSWDDNSYVEIQSNSGQVRAFIRENSDSVATDHTAQMTIGSWVAVAFTELSPTSRTLRVGAAKIVGPTTSITTTGSSALWLTAGGLTRDAGALNAPLPAGSRAVNIALWGAGHPNASMDDATWDAILANPDIIYTDGTPAPVLSAPTAGTPGTTTITIGATSDRPSDGTMRFLRRVGGSAASAPTIASTGESQAATANPQSRVMTGFTAGSPNNFVDYIQVGAGGNSNVVSVGPFTMATVAPSVTSNPGNQSVTAGATATFSAAATGTPTPTVQWQRNGSDISGATSLSYTTPATTVSGGSANNGDTYRAGFTNAGGGPVYTSAATLTVSAAGTAPTITVQPANQTVTAGATATFSVTATGSGLTYQWRRNGTPIGGATSSSYTTPATTVSGGTANNGDVYSVVVTGDTAPAATSSNATLTVNAGGSPPPPPPPPPSGHDVGPIFNNTYSAPLEGITAHFTWYPGGRIGSLTGITPTEGTGLVGSDGMLAIAPSGAGCVFVTKRNTSAVDDDVFYQAFAS